MFSFILLLFLIGFVGSFISGMVGIGGAIIKYPMLLYVPPLFGFAAFTAHEVSGISAVEVVFATLGGVWAYRKSPYLNKTLILNMGIGVLAGSFIGGYGSRFFADSSINIIYAILATVAAIMMFVPKKNNEELPPERVTFHKGLAFIIAFIVGLASGVVGAGGAFILVPLMLVVLKLPTRMTVASSLAITFISSIGSAIGKISTGQVLLVPTLVMIAASMIAAPLGAKLGQKTNVKVLRVILAVLILATAIKIWVSL